VDYSIIIDPVTIIMLAFGLIIGKIVQEAILPDDKKEKDED